MSFSAHLQFELISEFPTFQGSNLIQTKIAPPSDKSGNQSPIVAFILLERYNAIKLVQSIHSSLAALSKVIRGTQLLASDVQNLAAALLNQEVFFVFVIMFKVYTCVLEADPSL